MFLFKLSFVRAGDIVGFRTETRIEDVQLHLTYFTLGTPHSTTPFHPTLVHTPHTPHAGQLIEEGSRPEVMLQDAALCQSVRLRDENNAESSMAEVAVTWRPFNCLISHNDVSSTSRVVNVVKQEDTSHHKWHHPLTIH